MTLSINSRVAVMTPASTMSRTVLAAWVISAKVTSMLALSAGAGSSPSTALVIIPSVPSEPTMRSTILYPETLFTVFVPTFIISPVGSTSSSILT